MSPEIRVTPTPTTVNDSKDASVTPKFVSILNSEGLEPSVDAGKNCVRPCYGQPPPCYGSPPPCYGGR